MATIPEPENPGFPEVYEIALDDDVIGGPDGISNKQAKELVERTAYLRGELKEQIEVEKETRETSINNLQKHLINEIFELREHVEEDVVNKFNKEVFSLRAEIPEYIKDEDKSQARITEGSANAYTLTIPGITELFAGLRLNVIFHAANTSATVNININGLGDRRVYQAEALNPVARQIQTGSQWVIEFTGSAFVMYSSRITTGEANNYTLTLDPPITEYIPGKRYHVIFHVANTSATVNININGLGDRLVYRYGNTSPIIGQIQTGSHWLLEDNGAGLALVSSGDLPIVTQAEAEAGTSATVRAWSPQRVSQAIKKISSPVEYRVPLYSERDENGPYAVGSICGYMDVTVMGANMIIVRIRSTTAGTVGTYRVLYARVSDFRSADIAMMRKTISQVFSAGNAKTIGSVAHLSIIARPNSAAWQPTHFVAGSMIMTVNTQGVAIGNSTYNPTYSEANVIAIKWANTAGTSIEATGTIVNGTNY